MERIYVHEVGMRDGLQNEDTFVQTEDKIHLINALSEVGVKKMEVTSFVSPKAVPNMSDAEAVFEGITKNPNVIYSALVPNMKGIERAMSCDVDEINFLVSASNTHNFKNIRATTKETFSGFNEMVRYLKNSAVRINGALGTSFGCPFEGPISKERVLTLIEKYLDLGIRDITLADTTGMATPDQVYDVSTSILHRWPELNLTLHFHNTRGMGLANVLGGIKAGVNQFDASLGGLGGCPFAPGANGNISTEDLVHMLTFMDYETNTDLDQLIALARHLKTLVGHELPGQIMKAGKITDLYDATRF